jgi:hypothetical protein
MSFWDEITDFAEGAWEQASTGVQNALGQWAGDYGQKPVTSPAQSGEGAPVQTPVTTSEPVETQKTSAKMWELSTREIYIAGAVLAVALLYMRRG